MTQRIDNPFPLFLNARGALLDNGSIYIGTPNHDPETNPISTFWDKDLTLPAPQPLKTMGGSVVRSGSPSPVHVAEDDYSIRVRDNDNNEVFFVASTNETLAQFQPLHETLTKLAELTPTEFGQSLLEIANAAGLAAATGILDPLPLAGGTVTGNIVRNGAGTHAYHNDPALTSGRIFLTENGAADPTTEPGDIWLEKA